MDSGTLSIDQVREIWSMNEKQLGIALISLSKRACVGSCWGLGTEIGAGLQLLT